MRRIFPLSPPLVTTRLPGTHSLTDLKFSAVALRAPPRNAAVRTRSVSMQYLFIQFPFRVPKNSGRTIIQRTRFSWLHRCSRDAADVLFCQSVIEGGLPCPRRRLIRSFFSPTSKRRRGYPSETRVKRRFPGSSRRQGTGGEAR